MGLWISKSGSGDAHEPSSSVINSGAGQDEVEGMATRGGYPPINLFGPEPGGPNFHGGLLWTRREKGQSPTVESTLHDTPLPRPDPREIRAEVQDTINHNPHLFKIVTPIRVSAFESLLRSHPNRPFVESVLIGLREGFWPFANTKPESYPLTYDASSRPPRDREIRQFFIDQCRTEVACNRFSEPFGTQLLPGMYSMPILAVPKQGNSRFRLVVNHSASNYSTNSMISREDIAGARLDTIKDLADSLIEFRHENGPVPLVVFKCDVSSAFRQVPMHPLWQVKQIVTVEGQRHVDRCASFGNRASQRLWVGFMALVTWIGMFVRDLAHLKLYTDDCFSFELASSTEYYAPYQKKLPKKQAQLLKLWDELGIPHEERKQDFGETLEILGFIVNPNAMTIKLPKEKFDKLLSHIRDFCSSASGRQSLLRFLQLAGSMSSALYVFPLLKPGLRGLQEKIYHNLDKKPDTEMYVSATIKLELSWFAAHAAKIGGVHVMESLAWEPSEANHQFFCRASRKSMGCYYKEASTGFQAAPPPDSTGSFLKALCVCWAIHIAYRRKLQGRILIYTDNLDTVKMFDRLYTPTAKCNPILLSTIDILINKPFAIQVMVDSIQNGNHVAKALSQSQIDQSRKKFPDLSIVGTEALPTLASPKENAGWFSS